MKTSARSNVPAPALKIAILFIGIATGALGAAALIRGTASAQAQQTAPAVSPAQTRPAGGRGNGRGGIPGATPEQTAALSSMNADLAAPTQNLTAARLELLKASLASPRDDAAIKIKVQAVADAELALASARANAFAKIQASTDKFSPQQIAVLATTGGGRGSAGARGGVASNIPDLTSPQAADLTQLTGSVQQPAQALTAARAEVIRSSFADPRDDAAIKAKVEAVSAAELALAIARATAFERIQASPHRLAANQVTALAAMGGVLISGAFSEPQPMDFNDHVGYVSLFDGVSLKGWDGNPKFWRVENGAIVGESTPQNPSGNTYLAYRDIEAKDFTLKFEIKIEGSGGSGMQYRSKTGIPWLTAVAPNVTANTGPLNLNWMMTGPQADFWPVRVYSGQFYSENTPMRIMAWRGQVVEGAGLAPRRLMGNIGDRQALGNLVKMNDWNEYTVIARGGTFIHILNGQLMAVLIDDDPESSNNQSGLIGIEIEATTKVSTRNVWMKKLN
jgi:Spy/CpxP family protein refolding chaperone